MLLVSSGQARHAAEYAAMCKTFPKTKNYLAQKLSSVEVEKPIYPGHLVSFVYLLYYEHLLFGYLMNIRYLLVIHPFYQCVTHT